MDDKQKKESLQLNPLLSRQHGVGDGVDVGVESDNERKERGQWGTKLDYILSMIGYCVGLGNLWRFPYLCNRNGGGAFLIPFLFFLLVCGLPMFFLEVTIAQFSGKGPTRVWDICPLLRGVGVGMVMVSSLISMYYNMIIAWCIYYIIRSCSTMMPWMTCTNWWNTALCVEETASATTYVTNVTNVRNYSDHLTNVTFPIGPVGSNVSAEADTGADAWKNDTLSHTSLEEFWQYNTLRISGGLEEVGELQWHLVLCLLGSWTIVFFCLIRGVRSVGKVVYVTATLPYLLLLILLIRGLTLPGAVDGLIFFLKPDFSKLLEVQVWLEACLQVFYSLGPTWGGLITMASYNKFNNNCLRDSIVITFVGEGTSIFAGFVIFTILGAMAHRQGVHVSEVVSSGPGLGFVAYPQALSGLPIPQLWSVIFFVMLLTVGLDSQFVNVEVVVTGIMDSFPRLLRFRIIITAILCSFFFIIGLLFCTNGGIYMFQLADWYVAALMLILSILECFIVAWIYGFKRLDEDLELMIGRKVPIFFKVILTYITPLVFTVAIVFTLAQYTLPTYGKYEYPYYSAIIGWIFAAIPIIPIPVFIIWELGKAEGSLRARIAKTISPSDSWLPNNWSSRTKYRGKEQITFKENICHLCIR
ncbi:sodium- and chloride-dependent glycine transporter 2-like isoform X3 [Gigantopelta aegis]|uniref:sodium- and chloride-dependent glycine transporter 2-like isoform X3 n=1 Tax=Gigantopelta aegis TaxID=1735272 RepID=UPI001B88BDE6|nr:sodium- and chloride-dependent glycine transporter 2-like isoform X3 [Gigantopelta aegis]